MAATRGNHTGEAPSAAFDLGPELSAGVGERARGLGVTTPAFLAAAFGLTLSRWTGVRALRAAPPPDGAPAPPGGFDLTVDDTADTGAFLRSVPPLPDPRPNCSLMLRFASDSGAGDAELALEIHRFTPTVTGTVRRLADTWDPAALLPFTADLRAAVEELAGPVGPLADVRCVAPERRALLARVNAAARDFPRTGLDELFRAAARRTPRAVAVRAEDGELTYAALDRAAARQARLLRAAGVRPGDTVLVALPRSTAEVVAVLGAVRAGAAYVGVELAAPAAHTAAIVGKCAPAAVLTDRPDHPALGAVTKVDTWQPSWPAGTDPRPAPDAPAEAASVPADPERPAYVAFTSGSTGAPKGVLVPHRGVVRLVLGADYARLGPGERMLRLSPLAFDASTLELWGALLTGATLEVYPPGLAAPSEIGDFLVERGVTVAWFTAGLFRLLAEFAPHSLGGVRQVLTGGDVVPHEHIARLLALHPGLTVTNGYGPTENTTFTTTHSVRGPEEADGPLPIGTPVPGTRVYVLDAAGRLVPPGAVGELYTGGAGLALGYIGDPAETDRRFGYFSSDVPERLYRTGDLVRLDGAGRLHFLGRADDQVKVRGYRVELGAVAAALTAQPDVKDAVVFADGADSAAKRLVAALVAAPGAPLDPQGVRAALAARLPAYMVPALWAVVDGLPLTRNGKVDRRALLAAAVPVG